MTTAEQIGELQAKELVNKLELDKASSDAPKQIEVLLPYDAADGHDAKTDTSFAQNMFKGIWKVLEPYFKDGKAASPSETLTASTTKDDWRSRGIRFVKSRTNQIGACRTSRRGQGRFAPCPP